MTVGIYIIRNKINNKVYVGKSKNIERRWKQYSYGYRNQNLDYLNQHLLNSMNIHGFDNFEFIIEEECDFNLLPERELFWMIHYNSFDMDYGYNLRLDSSSGMIVHDSTSKKISNRLKVEWNEGVREQHGAKLKESWERNDRSRQEQSERMVKSLTKYLYNIRTEDFELNSISYKELKQLKLHGVLGKFMKYKLNKVQFKGYTIERVLIRNERSTDTARINKIR